MLSRKGAMTKGEFNMKTTYLTILMFFAAAGVALAVDPYDYWVAIAQVPSTTTANSVIQKVVVFIGNRGPFGGPNYDVTITVKTASGQSVCSAGLATQPPLLKGQQLNVLAFQLSYPKESGKLKPGARKLPTHDKYVVFANISTQYPNDDTNTANGFQFKEFSFPTGGKASCEKLVGQ
jgi:hypothetical protein